MTESITNYCSWAGIGFKNREVWHLSPSDGSGQSIIPSVFNEQSVGQCAWKRREPCEAAEAARLLISSRETHPNVLLQCFGRRLTWRGDAWSLLCWHLHIGKAQDTGRTWMSLFHIYIYALTTPDIPKTTEGFTWRGGRSSFHPLDSKWKGSEFSGEIHGLLLTP